MKEEEAEEARRAAEEEDANDDEAPRGARSDDDDPISDVEGSDPEDETEQQSRAIETAYANLQKGATQKSYGGGTRYYRSHSWLNSHVKAFQWAYRTYPRRADAIVQDLRKLKAVQNVLKAAKERDANQSKETDFLWLNSALGRGQDATNRQLPDQFSYSLQFVGPDVADVFATVTRNEKTNQNGRAKFIGAMRHRNVINCCVGAEAMRSFYRFHVQDRAENSCPDFSSRRAWYDTPVAPGRATKRKREKGSQGVTYQTYYDYFKKAFQANGITSDKVVHAGRGHRARAAAAAGAKEREIQGLGQWTYAQFDMSYLTSLPAKALIIQAGFTEDWMDRRPLMQTYVIPRSRVHPPEELLQLVFPWLDEALVVVKKNGEPPHQLPDPALGIRAPPFGFPDWNELLRSILLSETEKPRPPPRPGFLTSPRETEHLRSGFPNRHGQLTPRTSKQPRGLGSPGGSEHLNRLPRPFQYTDDPGVQADPGESEHFRPSDRRSLTTRNLEQPARIRDIAAEAYLVRPGKERIIFLQDAAVLWDEWKDLVFYQDPVF
ncbi:putative Integrase-like, catalytic core [Klebsormidium nitens]|uniref:Putative Integrase-like, catalytic core n=1 Tax=Klebsormidium nitens TaxID=105231 RepID=A0A1Y1IUF2_KLENI|nr:putative Integrase-like, catalytic core [Klebsormidium nitens]|eukprot:GAQ92307.1 putative Integrase-like, catalytic core [Klebsormidium nitens]